MHIQWLLLSACLLTFLRDSVAGEEVTAGSKLVIFYYHVLEVIFYLDMIFGDFSMGGPSTMIPATGSSTSLSK